MYRSLEQLVRQILPEPADWKIVLLQNWRDIIGNLKDHVRLEKIQDDNSLVLGVSNTAWMQELHFLSNMLIQKINATLAHPHIKQIRFKYSPARAKKRTLQGTSSVVKKLGSTIRLTAGEQQALQRVKDQHLQQALKQFLIRCRREESYEDHDPTTNLNHANDSRS
jgi:hypothetical protein